MWKSSGSICIVVKISLPVGFKRSPEVRGGGGGGGGIAKNRYTSIVAPISNHNPSPNGTVSGNMIWTYCRYGLLPCGGASGSASVTHWRVSWMLHISGISCLLSPPDGCWQKGGGWNRSFRQAARPASYQRDNHHKSRRRNGIEGISYRLS